MDKPERVFESKIDAGGYASRRNRKARKYFYSVRHFSGNKYGVFKVKK